MEDISFDIKSFEQTATLLGSDLKITVEEYLEDAQLYTDTIQKGFHENHIKDIARSSHILKSNSKAFGLMALSQSAERINKAAENIDIEALEELTADIQKIFMIAKEELERAVIQFPSG